MIIKIENLNESTTKDKLKSVCENFAKVKSIAKSRKTAFIKLKDKSQARVLKSQLNGMAIDNQIIRASVKRISIRNSVCNSPLGLIRMF